ncbi:AsmA family protein [Emticicia sp. 21SJ11W-3]|uniref:AsmA family protein n=1 Tax=Emticicia sp. 21SJ11W-3 TaxID=2916755 RepID=UPI00209CE53F|nr:AsmA family protein [Emticicia sp. 21SJ11W-3]UTA67132.1 DUF3971 domain-containing protein [Emticicia sp. 21SJ11W-3]
MSSKFFRVAFIIIGVLVLLLAGVGLLAYLNQDKIFDRLKSAANEKIDGTLEIRSFKFTPFNNGVGFTFSLMGVKLSDKDFAKHNTPLIDAGTISITLKTTALLQGKAEIHALKFTNGSLNIFRRKDGTTNLAVFANQSGNKPNQDKKEDNRMLEQLDEIVFRDFHVQYIDSLQDKSFNVDFHDFVNKIDFDKGIWNVKSRGNTYFKGLVFNKERGGFLTDQEVELKLDVAYMQQEKQLVINPSEIETATRDKIQLSGMFDFSESARTIQLDFSTNKLRLTNARKLLTKHLSNVLEKIKIDPIVTADVHLKGKLGERIPKVDINFDARSFQYQLRVGLLRDLSTQGIFTNHYDEKLPANDDNTRITGNNIRGMFETVPLEAKLVITNLDQALAEIECTLKADPDALNGLLDPDRYKVKDGLAVMKMNYKGNIKTLFDEKKRKINGLLFGNVSLQNLAITYLPKKISIQQIRGDVAFTGEEVRIPNIQVFDGRNKLFINGDIVGLVPYLYLDNYPLKARVNINIPDWELNWLKVLLNLDNNKPKRSSDSKFTLSGFLDNAIDNIEVDATLQAGRFKYNRLTAQNLKGKVTLSSNKINLNSFSMNAFGGTFQISGDINNLRANGRPMQLNVNASVDNTDVKSVFSSFNNFGQYTITDRNLQGKLTSRFKFSALLKNDASLVSNSVRGVLSVDLRDAEIIDFDPFLKMKRLIFRNRQLEHVQFAPIVHEFTINGQEVEVKKMQIESNVITFFMDGVYSLGNKTDLNIQIPFSNLRKRDSTYQFREYDPNVGSNIYLKAIDENGKVNLKLMFKRPRKLPFRAFR